MKNSKFSQKNSTGITGLQEFDAPVELSDELFEVATGAGQCGMSCKCTCAYSCAISECGDRGQS